MPASPTPWLEVGTAADRASQPAGQDITQSRRRWHVLAVLCVGLFMLLLDGTIVNIAIPSIRQDFSAKFSQIEWVMNAYLLVFAVLLVTMGRLGDLFGRKRIFIVGIGLFTAASLACGLAPSINWLIGFRALQGLGGAMVMPSTLSILAFVFAPGERGAAMGIWGGVSGLATAAGPSLGGVIIEAASWPWIFIINVPIGLVVLVLAARLIPESKDPARVRRLDLRGVLVLSAALFALTFALIEGQNYGWLSVTILSLFGVSVVGLILFVLLERGLVQPLMDVSLFRSRAFTAANTTGLILAFGMMGVFFLLPVFFQAVLGYSAIKTGLVMTPMSFAVIVAAPLSGRLSDRFGGRPLVVAGMLLSALGFFLTMRVLALNVGWTSLVVPFVISGFGIGMVMAPTTSTVMGTVPTHKAGQASGVLSTLRQLGSVLGIAVMGAVLQNRAAAYIQGSVSSRLDSVPFIPADVKERILGAVGGSVSRLGEMGGGGAAGGMPAEFEGMSANLPSEAIAFLQDLFSRDAIMGDFVRAMKTTFVLAVAALLVGAVTALFITRLSPAEQELRPDASGSTAGRA